MEKINKTPEEWRKQLDKDTYEITRNHGTERAFTGKYWDHHESGDYLCACCQALLFRSKDKFDSGSGWPSFSDSADKDSITEKKDFSHGMVRTEVLCATCDAHLGHVFPDGPAPTGLRYCINSASLNFRKA